MRRVGRRGTLKSFFTRSSIYFTIAGRTINNYKNNIKGDKRFVLFLA